MTQQRDCFPDPEDGSANEGSQPGSAAPGSPAELIVMQPLGRSMGEQDQQRRSKKLDELVALIAEQELCIWESQQLTLSLLRHLLKFHDAVLVELSDDPMAPHDLIIRWAIDADRLRRSVQLLEDVELE